MSQDSYPRAHRGSTGWWTVIVLLLLPPVVLPLWVPLYDKTDPTLFGFPFFYWFQFALILVSAVMTVLVYLLSRLADRKGSHGRSAEEVGR